MNFNFENEIFGSTVDGMPGTLNKQAYPTRSNREIGLIHCFTATVRNKRRKRRLPPMKYMHVIPNEISETLREEQECKRRKNTR